MAGRAIRIVRQDEEQQQQGDGKHPGELSHHATVRKIAAAEAHLEMPVLRHTAPDRADDGRDILGPGREVERVIVTLGPGHDMFQVAGHCLAHQDADRDFSLGGMDERIAEQIVQAAQVLPITTGNDSSPVVTVKSVFSLSALRSAAMRSL